MRDLLIAANWKMHLGRVDQAVALVRRIRPRLSRLGGVEVVLCAPFTVLAALAEILRRSPVGLGAQNMHWEEGGPYTGEVAPSMLAGLCEYVIVGHSERRASGGTAEDDRAVNRKVVAALAHELRPIVCVGEALAVREAGRTHEVVGAQVLAATAGLTTERAARCVIAYEPLWAVGTGRPASPTDANRAITLTVRGALADRFGEAAARAVRVLYGGSVDGTNIAAFMDMPAIDGALVGGASLDEGFVELVENAVGARHSPRSWGMREAVRGTP